MNEFAPWVGWGFNLDFGPSMNRSIINLADDKPSNSSYLSNAITNRDLCGSSFDYLIASLANDGTLDLEPDLFTFSTYGSGGKFMLRHDYSPFLMPWQAVNINEEFVNGVISAFQVANPDGSNYHFGITAGGYGGTESQRTYANGGAGSPTDSGITTWQIGQITNLTSENKISFQYQTGGTVAQTFQSWGAGITYNDLGAPTSVTTTPQASRQVKEVTESNIYKIFFTNGEVEFVPSNLITEPRADTPESPYLKEIKAFS
jgi:hypothetical protein